MEIVGKHEESVTEPGSQELIETLALLTGLPESLLLSELSQILEKSGQSCDGLTLNQLREALAVYLEGIQADFVGKNLPF